MYWFLRFLTVASCCITGMEPKEAELTLQSEFRKDMFGASQASAAHQQLLSKVVHQWVAWCLLGLRLAGLLSSSSTRRRYTKLLHHMPRTA